MAKKTETPEPKKSIDYVVAKAVVINGAGMGQPIGDLDDSKLEQLKKRKLICTKSEFEKAQAEAEAFAKKAAKKRRDDFEKVEKEAAAARLKRNQTPTAKLAKGN